MQDNNLDSLLTWTLNGPTTGTQEAVTTNDDSLRNGTDSDSTAEPVDSILSEPDKEESGQTGATDSSEGAPTATAFANQGATKDSQDIRFHP